MFEEYMTAWHAKALLVYVLANCALPWYTMFSNRRVKPDPKRDEERFLPWVKHDYEFWNPWIIPFTHFFFLPRIFLCFCVLAFGIFGVWAVLLGTDPEKTVDRTRKWILLEMSTLMAKTVYILLGVYSWKKTRPDCDYSKWLGPDWKPTYENASIYIGNHTGINEVFNFFILHRPVPSFFAHHKVKQIPFIGPNGKVMECVFMDRQLKESRKEMFAVLERRQGLAEEGKSPPLVVYPEACSTNGTHLVQFKKGVFVSERSVQPFINRNWCLRGQAYMGDVLNIWHYFFLMMQTVWIHTEMLEMPVFKPNDYFWKHHWDGKDPSTRWSVYCEAVREAMADCAGLKLSNSTLLDKMEYKNIVWGKKIKDV